MSLEQARADVMAVVARIQADFTNYPLAIERENLDEIDQATQTDPYLQVEIDFLPGGGQLDLADQPLVRQYGQLCLYAVGKVGSGTAELDKLLDFVKPYFNLKRCGIVNFHAAQAVRGKPANGLYYKPMWLDFWYDTVSSK